MIQRNSSQYCDRVDVWCALRTGARWEKSVADQLVRAGVTTYLPLMTRVSQTKSKRQSAQIPLFAGYVFCSERQFRENELIQSACRQKVAQLLSTPDPAQLKKELAAIAYVLNDRQLVQERIYGQIGDTVRVVGGPFTGAVGEIVRLKPGSSRIVLDISFLGARVEATLDEGLLEKVIPSSGPVGGREFVRSRAS